MKKLILKEINGQLFPVEEEIENTQIQDTRSYSEKVTSYIREKYSIDDEIALINNYNLDNEKYKQEYEKYQLYRQECKEKAK